MDKVNSPLRTCREGEWNYFDRRIGLSIMVEPLHFLYTADISMDVLRYLIKPYPHCICDKQR